MQEKQHIAVIGAGIIGLCTAKSLTDAGFSVTLFDEHGVAQKCSKGNAGHFATEQVFPLAQASLLPKLPSMLLNPKGALRIDWLYLFKALPWFTRFLINMSKSKFSAHTKALRQLNEASLPAYKTLLGEENFEKLIHVDGSLLSFEHENYKIAESMAESFRAHGVAVKHLKGEEVFELEPSLSKNIKQALFFTEVGHSVEPYELCKSIYQLAEQQGAVLKKQKVTKIIPNNNGVMIELSSGAKHQFAKAVICTGAWSKPLAKQLGFTVPIDTERGYHAMIDNPSTLKRPVASADRQFIITPMQHGLRLAGTVEFAGLNAPENNDRATMLLDHAKALINGIEDKQVKTTWMGHRPSLPDSLPVLNTAPNNKNIVFAFGHQHLGLTQAAITAQIVSQLCLGEKTSIDLTPYRIDRF